MVINTESRKTFIELELIRNVAEVWDSRNKTVAAILNYGWEWFYLDFEPFPYYIDKKGCKKRLKMRSRNLTFWRDNKKTNITFL